MSTGVPAAPKKAAPAAARQGLPTAILEAADLREALVHCLRISGEGDAGRELQLRCAQLMVSACALGTFGCVADLIAAALACGHVESWMYESLAIAMEAAGMPRKDVKRVLLSNADLACFGSGKQAICICRHITRLDLTSRDAHALATTLAASNDDAVTPACVGPGVRAPKWPAGQRGSRCGPAGSQSPRSPRWKKSARRNRRRPFKAAADQALVREVVLVGGGMDGGGMGGGTV